ncbi:hypothetical protein [Phycicoccus sp.]|uniref:hypothetical protein n=1 Tax=Phycicoccus sp. TaxID=1902410 RepID=UPI002B702B8A|nr:hypothetical protein [Phycicoccus sp.]HMM95417.1 hypothetical protein [Phycicoccus sp.]
MAATVTVAGPGLNQPDARLALARAQNDDPQHRGFYHLRYMGGANGWAVVRIDHPNDLEGLTP